MEKEELTPLIIKAQAGDQEAMEELLRRAHTPVSYQCRKMLRDPRDAEDMTQEILLVIYGRLDKLKEPAAFWGWINTITVTRCVNALKRGKVDLQFSEDEDGHSVLDDLEELDEQQVPDKALDNAETTRMIEEIVNGLPEAQRICVLMYYYDEMSVRDIAETVGVPENTVKSRLNYARKAIKEQVLDYEKKGVKLYGLSPLPFLLYFLGRSAQEGADSAAAAAAVKQVLELGVSGAAAAGTTAAGAAATSGTAAGAAAAEGGAAAGTALSHLLGGLSVKLVVGGLIGVLAVGGAIGAVVIATQDNPAPTAAPTPPVETEQVSSEPVISVPLETGDGDGTIPEDPGPSGSLYETVTVYDPDTFISRTTLVTDLDNLEIYYEIPVFPESTSGIRVINTFFRELRDEFFRDETGEIARALDAARAPVAEDPYYNTYRCSIETFSDQITSIRLLGNWYIGGQIAGSFPAYTFRNDIGMRLDLLDVLSCTRLEYEDYLAQALRSEGLFEIADLSGDTTELPFYVSDGAVYVGVPLTMGRSDSAYVRLLAPIQLSGDAAPEPADRSAILERVAYYGDPAQCAMTAEQARAFADVIQSETIKLETQYTQDPNAQNRGEITAYAALIDIGGGNPILYFIGGLHDTTGSWEGSGYDGSLQSSGIWQYIDGQAVPFHPEAPVEYVYWNGLYLGISSGIGPALSIQFHSAEGGRLSESPISVMSRSSTHSADMEYQINGQTVSRDEFEQRAQNWGESAGQSWGGGAGSEIMGMKPAADTAIALTAWA